MRRLTRPALGLVALLLCAAVLAWRIRTIANEPRVALGPRAVQLMYNRMLALRIIDYARTHRRPAYYMDSVLAHLDSAEARLVSDLGTDLWGGRVYYAWTWCDFRLSSDAGEPWPRSQAAWDSTWREARARGRLGMPHVISEEYPWPRGVGRTHDCHGGP